MTQIPARRCMTAGVPQVPRLGRDNKAEKCFHPPVGSSEARVIAARQREEAPDTDGGKESFLTRLLRVPPRLPFTHVPSHLRIFLSPFFLRWLFRSLESRELSPRVCVRFPLAADGGGDQRRGEEEMRGGGEEERRAGRRAAIHLPGGGDTERRRCIVSTRRELNAPARCATKTNMAAPVRAARLFRLAGRTVSSLPVICGQAAGLPQRRCYVSASTGNNIQFRLDERTAHSSLDLFKKNTGVIYRMLGLQPSHVENNPERFRDWAVVFADEQISGGRHYWEVTVKNSEEFRLGVAEALMPRDDCVGTNGSSWVFGYAKRKWFAMTGNKVVPVAMAGKPERVGILLDYDAGLLELMDIEKHAVIQTIRAQFKIPLCPAFGLWDGELLTHSGLQEPAGLK